MAGRVFRSGALRDARNRAGLSQAGLEKLIADRPTVEVKPKQSKTTAPAPAPPRKYEWGRRVASWEGGYYQPRAADVPRLADALGVHPLDLLDGGQDEPSSATLRLAAGLTLAQLAERGHVAYGTCQRIDSGAVEPTPEVAAKLAATVGASIEDYLAAVVRGRG